jgi:hypothetical protein
MWTATTLVGGDGTMETNMGQVNGRVAPVSSGCHLGQSGAVFGRPSRRPCCIGNGQVPGPFFLIVANLLAVVAHAILAVMSEDEMTFVFGITLSGLAVFGCVWPMLVLIVGEIFGTARVAANNYIFYDGVTSAGGTFLLSKIVAQKAYEKDIDSHYSENNNDGVTGTGQKCFQTTHKVIVLLSLT